MRWKTNNVRVGGSDRSRTLLIGAASVILGLVLWTAVTKSGLVSTRFLASPIEIVIQFWQLLQKGYGGTPFYVHVGVSLYRTLLGFALAVVAGVSLGLMIGYVSAVAAAVSPWLAFLRPIPAIAFVPLVILWFGIGEFSKISLIFLASFLYITLNTAVGVKSVQLQLLRAASSLGAGQRQMFLHVIFPAALPQIFTGIRVGCALSWALVVAAELVAAQSGLGYMIMDASTFFRVTDVYVGVITIGVIGMVLEALIVAIERRVVHWRGK
ncbi:MAG: ABC transporter permease [Betaproteobacteria bacterium]|nr:ABC transporter permease [Betaproteobacteria bacterium]